MVRRQEKAGFTLIEISIVLTIIGLLIGATFAGMSMKRNLEVNRIMEDVVVVKEAVSTFKKKYNGLPGDLWNAQTHFGAGNTTNGDGNGQVADTSADNLRFWQHLSLAGFIQGNYDGATIKPGAGLMIGSIRTSGYRVAYNSTDGVHYLYAAKFQDANASGAIQWIATEYDRALVTPSEGWKLDMENDDGNPTTGMIRAADGGDAGTNCISASAYNLTYKHDTYIMLFRLNE